MFDGAINGQGFLAYVRRFLAPTPRPGGALAVDNLGSHKAAGVREAVEAKGACSAASRQPSTPDTSHTDLDFGP